MFQQVGKGSLWLCKVEERIWGHSYNPSIQIYLPAIRGTQKLQFLSLWASEV